MYAAKKLRHLVDEGKLGAAWYRGFWAITSLFLLLRELWLRM
jgi:hypothetical protein